MADGKRLACWQTGGPPTQLYQNGSLISNPAGLSSTMNEFFISKVNNLRKKIPPVQSDPLRYLREAMVNRSCLFTLQPVELAQVKKIIKGLKNSTATGVDYIDTNTVKLGCEILAPALMHVINLSITTSTFPDAWKWHKVVPLLKGAGCEKISPNNSFPPSLIIAS